MKLLVSVGLAFAASYLLSQVENSLAVSVAGKPECRLRVTPHMFYKERELNLLLNVFGVRSGKEICGRIALFASGGEEVLAKGTVADIGATAGKTHVFDLRKLKPGQYEVRVEALDRDGGSVLAEVTKSFELPEEPSWEYAVRSPDEVPSPWTPLTVQTDQSAKAQLHVSCWGRTYTFGASPLPEQILALNHTLLSGPVRISGRVDGRHVEWTADAPVVKKATGSEVVVSTYATDPAISLTTKVTIDFDGLMRFDCTLKPAKKVHLERLTLEIPFRREHAKLVYSYRDKFFQAPGLLPDGGVVRSFNPAIWLGTEDYGLQWFTESDQNWYVADADCAIEIVPDEEKVILRLNLVTSPITLDSYAEQTLTSVPQLQYTFGLQATPVREVTRDAWDLRIGIANYAYLTRRIGTKLAFDYFVDCGVKTALLFSRWTDVFGQPECVGHKQELLQAVKECHQRGMKVIVYLGSYFSDDSPQFPAHLQDFTCWRQPKPFSTYSYPARAPLGLKQDIYLTCNGSESWQDFILSGAEHLMDEYDIDGFYLDGVGTANPCHNEHHGCGYDHPNGKKAPSYPFFACRKMLRDLRAIVKSRKPDGIIDFHPAGFRLSASIGWVDNVWDGETILGPFRQFPAERENMFLTDYLSPELFRGQFLGRPWGSSSEFIGYRVPYPYEQLWAMTLLHDIPIRPTGSARYFEPASEIWSVMDTFGRKKAAWLPYWNNSDCVSVQPKDAYVSLYNHPKQGVLAVISNLSKQKENVEVRFALDKLGLSDSGTAMDAVTKESIPIHNGSIELELDSIDWKLVWVKP